MQRAAASYRGLIAGRAFDHMLMELAVQVDEGLADAAVDDGHAGGVGVGDGRVRGRKLRYKQNMGNVSGRFIALGRDPSQEELAKASVSQPSPRGAPTRITFLLPSSPLEANNEH